LTTSMPTLASSTPSAIITRPFTVEPEIM